jgi:Acetyltransferase (GNAT) family
MIKRFYWALKNQFDTQVMLIFHAPYVAEPFIKSDEQREKLYLENRLETISADRLSDIIPGPAPKDKERLGQGHILRAFMDTQKVMSRFWLTRGTSSGLYAPWEGGISLGVRDELDYIWDCLTMPEYRQQGLYAEGLKMLIQEAHINQRTVGIYCRESNLPSRRVIERVGFRLIARLTLHRFGPIGFLRGQNRLRWCLLRRSFDLAEIISC